MIERVVYGAFKGFGDLLSAVPTISAELNRGREMTLLVFPQLTSFVTLIDFGSNAHLLNVVVLPVPMSMDGFKNFFRAMSGLAPNLIWLSPHAVRRDASWKIPVLLWCIKRIYWPKAILSGAASEPGAVLFTKRIAVDRSLPLARREWLGYSLSAGLPLSPEPRKASFVRSLAGMRVLPRLYDVIFHPGASWANKKWPLQASIKLIENLAVDCRVAIVGLETDVAAVRASVHGNRNITFVVGTVEEAVAAIARSNCAITMDSGAMHFAVALDVPTIALFGPTDPAEIIAPSAAVDVLYAKTISCQPCWRPHCIHASVHCMEQSTADEVEKRVRRVLGPFTACEIPPYRSNPESPTTIPACPP